MCNKKLGCNGLKGAIDYTLKQRQSRYILPATNNNNWSFNINNSVNFYVEMNCLKRFIVCLE